jgi:hypothetical protein
MTYINKNNYLYCLIFLILFVNIINAGAPSLTSTTLTLTPNIQSGATNPPGYTVSTFLNPIIKDGTMVDDFEDNNNTSIWGGLWHTFNDAGGGGLTQVTPYPFQTPSAGGYNSSYCAKINITLVKNNLPYAPYGGIAVWMKSDQTILDLTRATGFRYWYKGGKHIFKVETQNINTTVQSNYQDTIPASPNTWRQAILTWDSLWTLTYATGAVGPVTATGKQQVQKFSWVIQGDDGRVDSLLIDNVEVLGFSDRGIAVNYVNNTNGVWQFSINSGSTWTNFGTLSDNSATLLNASAQVRFVPNAAYVGPSNFTFRAWNQSDGRDNGATGQVIVPTGGVTAYSDQVANATVQVVGSTAPVITTQPASQTVNEGGTLTLSVTATNATAYQWRKDGVAISGATSATYTKTNVTAADGGNYTVMVKNATDSVLSSQASVTIRLKPANATVTPATQSVLVGASVSFTVNVATGTPPYTYQWRKDGVDLAGKTSQTLAISPVALSDAGSYTCVVSNAAGSVTSSAGVLNVSTPIKASFKVSDSIAKAPATIQFTDQSTGNFTKRLWYFGDGKLDTSSNAQNPTHEYTTTGNFIAKLVLLNGTQRADSFSLNIKIYNDNPITITGKYAGIQKAEITFANYEAIPTSFPVPYADSLRLWYKAASIPTSESQATISAVFSLQTIKSATPPFKTTVNVNISQQEQYCGFMTQVHWYNGTSWNWSSFNVANGTLVLMQDTFPPVNTAAVGGRFLGGDSVALLAYNMKSIDTSLVDSFAIWYGLSESDSIPNFSNMNQTIWFNINQRYSIINATNGKDSVIVRNALFNTGVVKKLYCALVLKGKNDKLSSVVKAAYLSGVNRPSNPIMLRAVAVSASKIKLNWNPIGGVSAIRIWYSANNPVPVNQAVFTSPPFDSISVPSVSDTQLIVGGLRDNTHYYFGAQVYQNGLWSFVTDSSSADAVTLLAGDSLPYNSVKILSVVFDTLKNEIKVKWRVDNSLPDTLVIGISYSTTSFPQLDTSIHQIIEVKSAIDSAIVKLREPLVFSSNPANPTYYYIALWETRLNGAWNHPSDSSKAVVASPYYNWQKVTYFTKSPGDTNIVFNGNILIVTENVGAADVSPTIGVIRLFNPDPASLVGFIPIGIPFYFSEKEQSAPFRIKIWHGTLPVGYTLEDIKIYRYKDGVWYVDRTTEWDGSGYVSIKTRDIDYPFMALIDTLKPVLTRNPHSDTVVAWSDIFDTLYISDNIGNVTWNYAYAKGGDAFTVTSMRQGTLNGKSGSAYVLIPGAYVSPDNGLRARIIINDGRNIDTFNVSRQVLRADPSDFEMVYTDPMKWIPLRVTASLTNTDINTIFQKATGGDVFEYDVKKIRIFRWLPHAGNTSLPNKWVEYSQSTASIFTFMPSILIWVKTRESWPIIFGGGITPSLKEPYKFNLEPNNFNDFALPFKFDITIGDIIDHTGAQAENLQFYLWERDQSSGRYVSKPVYLKAFESIGLANKNTIISSKDLTGYTVFCPSDASSYISVPPIPYVLSKYSSGITKKASQNGWAISLVTKLEDGTTLSPVYCGYSKSSTNNITYLPLPPSFIKTYAGVVDERENKIYGHAVAHDLSNGGCIFKIAFVNEADIPQKISCYINTNSSLPQGFTAKIFDAEKSSTQYLSENNNEILLNPNQITYKWLVIGSSGYLSKMASIISTDKLDFAGIYLNPITGAVSFKYFIPQIGISKINFSIYDMMGRLIWAKTEEGNIGGERQIIWNAKNNKRVITSGAYIIKMEAFNDKQKSCAIFKEKFIYVIR